MKYTVNLTTAVYAYYTFEVEADSKEQALEIVKEEKYQLNFDFSTGDEIADFDETWSVD